MQVSKLARPLNDLLSLLFPRLCQACGNHLVRNEEVICTACLLDMPLTGFHLQRENALEQSLWGRCYAERAAAWAYYRRGGKMQHLVHRLKYSGIKEVGSYLGRYYGTILLDSGFMEDIDWLVPVPLHPSRQRKRGFNQAEIICRGISDSTGVPLLPDALLRKKRSDTQTRKSRVERWENVENIFAAGTALLPDESHLLLVDDVITTGSTIESCVNILHEQGRIKVSVAALAVAESGTS